MTARTRSGVGPLLWHALASHLGLFALVPFLPIILTEDYGMPAAVVGSTLLMFNIVMRGGSVLVTDFVERTSPRRVAVVALAVAGTCLVAVGLVEGARQPGVVVAALVGVAFCLSIAGVVVRALLAVAAGDRSGRARAFARLSVVANVAAGTAPIAVGWLTDHGDGGVAFVASGACYLVGAALLGLVARGSQPAPAAPGGRVPFRLGPYLQLYRQQRSLFGWSVTFWFFYAQMFSALPVLLSRLTGSGVLIGSVYTFSSVLVIVAQVPVTAFVVRRSEGRAGRSLTRVFPVGMACFTLQLGLLAAAAPRLPAVYAAAAASACAVLVIVPVMDTLFSELAPADRQVTAFNARKLTWAVGEGAGAWAGVSVQLWFASVSDIRTYWWLLAGLALAATLVLLRPQAHLGGAASSHGGPGDGPATGSEA